MCNLFSDYAVAVQLCLGFSIVLVLITEYIIEKIRKPFPRTFVQFWFDSFKLCCGALISHGFNVWIAYILNREDVDECAVYTIAFYYEATGVTVVQMMQYGLVKYSRRKYLELYHKYNKIWHLSTKIWFWISYPGHYTTPEDNPIAAAERGSIVHGIHNNINNNNDNINTNTTETTALMAGSKGHDTHYDSNLNNTDDNLINGMTDEEILAINMGDIDNIHGDDKTGNITFLQTRIHDSLYMSVLTIVSLIGTILVCLFSYYIMGYEWYLVILISFMAITLFITLGICTPACLWQTTSWVCIKIIERSLWTLFVYVQKEDFISYANLIQFNDDILEAVLYIAIIPLILGVLMFWAFSQIARMKIPFVNLKEFASDVMARFNLRESLKVGVFSTIIYNVVLFIPAELALWSWESAGVLFLMMVCVPCVTCAILVLLLFILLSDIDETTSFVNSKHSLISNPKKASMELTQ